jgi:hypothetical protein
MKQIVEKLLAKLWKPVTERLTNRLLTNRQKLQTPTPPKQQAVVKEETPTKVDLRATRQIDPRYTRPIGKL